MTEPVAETTPRERVPCDDVAIVAAYEAGRRDLMDDVMDMMEGVKGAPDGYYHARQAERIVGWSAAIARVVAKLEEMRDAE